MTSVGLIFQAKKCVIQGGDFELAKNITTMQKIPKFPEISTPNSNEKQICTSHSDKTALKNDPKPNTYASKKV